MIIMKPDPNPIIISDGKVQANLDISFSIKNMGAIEVGKYYHRKGIKVYSNGKAKRVKKGTPKSRMSSALIELRKQFTPFCCDAKDYDPEYNPPLYMPDGLTSERDLVYKWHFAHRHGFPSDIHGSGRGQQEKVRDIVNHPLSYMLMCNEHHEEYDRENGEWRNPKNVKDSHS